jgi:hypothetical protein
VIVQVHPAPGRVPLTVRERRNDLIRVLCHLLSDRVQSCCPIRKLKLRFLFMYRPLSQIDYRAGLLSLDAGGLYTAELENRQRRESLVSSNPTSSATPSFK